MNKLPRFFIPVLEILLILILIFAIIAGLERIGIFSFSEFLPWYDAENSENHSYHYKYDDRIYDALTERKNSETVTVVSDLSREHVFNLLDEISVSEDYYQEYNISIFDEIGNAFNSKATILRKNGLYDVSLYSAAGSKYKRICENGNNVEIYIYNDGKENKTTLKKGGFDIQSDTGIIMMHDRFFSDNASYADDEFYSVAYSDFGSVLYFEFFTNIENISQKECYWLSLDYGVVIKAECYESDKLVYSLETTTINSNI